MSLEPVRAKQIETFLELVVAMATEVMDENN